MGLTTLCCHMQRNTGTTVAIPAAPDDSAVIESLRQCIGPDAKPTRLLGQKRRAPDSGAKRHISTQRLKKVRCPTGKTAMTSPAVANAVETLVEGPSAACAEPGVRRYSTLAPESQHRFNPTDSAEGSGPLSFLASMAVPSPRPESSTGPVTYSATL